MKATLAQLDPGAVGQNLGRACEIIGTAETDLLLFPELFLGGYATEDLESRSVRVDGPEMAQLREAARENGTAVVIGITEDLGDGRYSNSAACIDEEGRSAGIYRKVHLFGAKEEDSFVPGERHMVVELAGHRLGVQVCFDTEFPEPSRAMALAGAEGIVTIAANMSPYGADHRLAGRARALDNRIPHLYVNRVGDESGHRFVGGSRFIGPDGSVECELADREGLLEHTVTFPAPDPLTAYPELVRSVPVQYESKRGEE